MDGRELSRAIFDAWNERDWDAIRGVLHPDFAYAAPCGECVAGVDAGFETAWKAFADAFPDGRFEVRATHADGNSVVTQFRMKGTHGAVQLPEDAIRAD